MAEEKRSETKIVKGGFRATLALIISTIALILSIAAYGSTAKEEELNARIKTLQDSFETMKKESLAEVDKLRNETAKLLERLKDVVEKKDEKQQEG
jgi:hypothetical protein